MFLILVTLATFQREMSALKDVSPWNREFMSATREVSQSAMSIPRYEPGDAPALYTPWDQFRQQVPTSGAGSPPGLRKKIKD